MATSSKKSSSKSTFTEEEKAAMKEAAAERRSPAKGDDEQAILDKIAEMSAEDADLATRVHAIIRATAPQLTCRTWYGMPAYALDGKVLVFFQPAGKFKARYSTLGFNGNAQLDQGSMWPTSYALTRMTQGNEKQIADLVTTAVG